MGGSEWGNSYWGDCRSNAVVKHQQDQAGYPTSGVSTTPHYERACFYATHGGRRDVGIVYVIDVGRCLSLGVTMFLVKAHALESSVPQDDEVILVAQDFGDLPQDIVVDTTKVRNR